MKPLVLALLLLLTIASALAAPPFEAVQTSVKGLTIVHPEVNVYKVGSPVELYFHVYNGSGSQVNATQIACTIDIYNKTDNHHLEDATLTSFQGHEFRHVLNMSKYTVGEYGYLVTCSPTSGQTESGFVGGQFFLSLSGEVSENDAFVIPAILILLPLLFGFLLLKWCVNLGEDHSELKIFISIGSLMSVFVSLWMGVLAVNRFLSWVEMQDALAWQAWLYGIIFTVLIIYFIIYLIISAFNTAKEAKVERLRY